MASASSSSSTCSMSSKHHKVGVLQVVRPEYLIECFKAYIKNGSTLALDKDDIDINTFLFPLLVNEWMDLLIETYLCNPDPGIEVVECAPFSSDNPEEQLKRTELIKEGALDPETFMTSSARAARGHTKSEAQFVAFMLVYGTMQEFESPEQYKNLMERHVNAFALVVNDPNLNSKRVMDIVPYSYIKALYKKLAFLTRLKALVYIYFINATDANSALSYFLKPMLNGFQLADFIMIFDFYNAEPTQCHARPEVERELSVFKEKLRKVTDTFGSMWRYCKAINPDYTETAITGMENLANAAFAHAVINNVQDFCKLLNHSLAKSYNETYARDCGIYLNPSYLIDKMKNAFANIREVMGDHHPYTPECEAIFTIKANEDNQELVVHLAAEFAQRLKEKSGR